VFLSGQTEVLGPTNFTTGVASSRRTGGTRPRRCAGGGGSGGGGDCDGGGGSDDNVGSSDESNHAESLILTLHPLIKILSTVPLRLDSHHCGSPGCSTALLLSGGLFVRVALIPYPKWHC